MSQIASASTYGPRPGGIIKFITWGVRRHDFRGTLSGLRYSGDVDLGCVRVSLAGWGCTTRATGLTEVKHGILNLGASKSPRNLLTVPAVTPIGVASPLALHGHRR